MGQLRRRLRPRFEPARQVGHAVANGPGFRTVAEPRPRCGGISHDGVSEQLPPATHDSLFEAVDQPAPVCIIADDLLACAAPRRDVSDGALKFDPQSPWHGARLEAWKTDCQAENNEPSLSPRSARENRSVTAKRVIVFRER